MTYDDSLEQCLATSRGKTHEKILRDSNLGQEGKNCDKNLSFCRFLKFG